jgi:peptide/nickel transport system substrate-binding protein
MKTTLASLIRLCALFFCTILPLVAIPASAEPHHGIAMHGELKYPPKFTHFAYVNPDAPKGGRLVLGVHKTVFDSVNPLIIKGTPAAGTREYIYESLMARSFDEPFSLYPLIAESIDVPDDRGSVTFTLNPGAHFSDGKPVTVDDVIFSLELLREKGRPNHRSYYSKIERVERVGERGVKMVFKDGGDREMPLIMGLMPVLPKHLINPDTFDKTSLEPPVGSGPYIVTDINPGVSITFKRDPNYWGRNLPSTQGMYNFNEIRYEYYRDGNAMFEAFKKGLFHYIQENDPGHWARDYDFPAANDGRVIKAAFKTGLPAGMNALVFNTRRPLFADKRVRQALTLLFDSEWQNQNLYFGLFARTEGYFDGSELSSVDQSASVHERKLLAAFPDAVSPEVMEGTFRQPTSDGSGTDRTNKREALKLLKDAGYDQVDGKLVNLATSQPVTLEMLAENREQERLFLVFARALQDVGIEVQIRLADATQYQSRRTKFDFDMIQNNWVASLSPGNEQSYRWSSQAADTEGSFNYAGVKSPAVDAMIANMLAANSQEDFVASVRALDRVLIAGAYVIPLFHLPQQWVGHWQQMDHPKEVPLYGVQIDTWWMKDNFVQAGAR